MPRRLHLQLASIVCAALLCAASAVASPPQPPPMPAPAFGPGEQLSFNIQYLGFTAGTAQLTVGAEIPHWGGRVTPIVVQARSTKLLYAFPIEDKFITYWDPHARRSVGHDLYADENRKRRRQRAQLDHQAGKAEVTKQKEGEPTHKYERSIEPGSMDIAAAAYALRNLPLKVGTTSTLPVFTGDKSFHLDAFVEGSERLQTPMGPREALRLRVRTSFEGEFRSKRDLRLFVTADAAHIPLRIEADFFLGTVVAELSLYRPGRIPAATQPADGGVTL